MSHIDVTCHMHMRQAPRWRTCCSAQCDWPTRVACHAYMPPYSMQCSQADRDAFKLQAAGCAQQCSTGSSRCQLGSGPADATAGQLRSLGCTGQGKVALQPCSTWHMFSMYPVWMACFPVGFGFGRLAGLLQCSGTCVSTGTLFLVTQLEQPDVRELKFDLLSLSFGGLSHWCGQRCVHTAVESA
jgi:hypothetical protein